MEIKVQIDPEYTVVTLTVVVDVEKEKEVTLNPGILEAVLSNNGVIVGIKEEVIKEICDNKLINKPIVVARCIPPTEGNDARVEILKKTKRRDEILPVKKSENEIDYISPREGFLPYVRKGEVLAVKYPPTPGNPGKTVLGRAIPGKLGKEIALDLFQGANTEIAGNELKASIEGIVELSGIKVNVEGVHEIHDHIGMNTGSIDLPMDLDVSIRVIGDIQRGYSVKCRNLYVSGCVEDAEIQVKQLVVKEGIVGVSELPIIADSISTGYINGTRKVTAKSLKVLREISSGAEVCGEVIQAFTIQGSTAIAKEMIWTDYLNGNNLIMVGVDYVLKKEVDILNRKLLEIKGPLEELRNVSYAGAKKLKQLQALAKMNPKHPLLQKELPKIKEVKDKLDKFEKYCNELLTKRDELSTKMYSEDEPFLLVKIGFSKDSSAGIAVNPDSVIYLKNISTKITEATSGGLFTLNKYGVSYARQYNIKEIKTKLDLLVENISSSSPQQQNNVKAV